MRSRTVAILLCGFATVSLRCNGGVQVDPGEVPPTLEVVFSHEEGVFTEAFELTLSCPVDGATIRYTLDNAIPDGDSTEYAEPIHIDRFHPRPRHRHPRGRLHRGRHPRLAVPGRRRGRLLHQPVNRSLSLDPSTTDTGLNDDPLSWCETPDDGTYALASGDHGSPGQANPSCCVDADGDGVTDCDGDCDEADPLVHPGADELCNGVDDDCDGDVDENEAVDSRTWYLDADGYTVCQGDCDDSEPLTWPGAPEQCDLADNDCDGEVDEETGEDMDGDGYNACQGDCNNVNADVFPGAAEQCNGMDDDCDGSLPADEADEDGDGWMTCEGDCDDSDASANPADEDGDGWSTCDEPPDCVDDNAMISPGTEENCDDGFDNDCDGLADASDPECDTGDDDTADDDDGDDDDAVEDDDDTADESTGCTCRTDGRAAPGASLLLIAVTALAARRRGRPTGEDAPNDG